MYCFDNWYIERLEQEHYSTERRTLAKEEGGQERSEHLLLGGIFKIASYFFSAFLSTKTVHYTWHLHGPLAVRPRDM